MGIHLQRSSQVLSTLGYPLSTDVRGIDTMSDHTRVNEQPQNIPYGYCHCGCGQKTRIARQSHTQLGWVKGEPVRFIVGHSGGRRGLLSVEQRFWEKVSKTDGCWEWTGSLNNQGYGQIRIDGKSLLAHRVSWGMAFGPIPDGLLVLHRCDNPPCIRPDHLFLGTFADNSHDMIQKGRQVIRVGEDCVSASLTYRDVATIRELASTGLSSRKLAKQFGVSHTTILDIVRGNRYKTNAIQRGVP